MADSSTAPRPLLDDVAQAPARSMRASRAGALRELLAAALWSLLGGYLYAAGLHEPVRPLLLWGGALPLTWGLTRAVIGLWHLLTAGRRGS